MFEDDGGGAEAFVEGDAVDVGGMGERWLSVDEEVTVVGSLRFAACAPWATLDEEPPMPGREETQAPAEGSR